MSFLNISSFSNNNNSNKSNSNDSQISVASCGQKTEQQKR